MLPGLEHAADAHAQPQGCAPPAPPRARPGPPRAALPCERPASFRARPAPPRSRTAEPLARQPLPRAQTALLGLCALGFACASSQPGESAAANAPRAGDVIAEATIRNTDGATVGRAHISHTAAGPQLHVQLESGIPAGTHGIHIHTTGRCEPNASPPFGTAGGHFNPTGRQHGRLNPEGPHVGDLPNITVAAAGTGTITADIPQSHVGTGAGTLFDQDGSAIVVHQNADDERTNDGPAGPGNSGARIACGEFTRR